MSHNSMDLNKVQDEVFQNHDNSLDLQEIISRIEKNDEEIKILTEALKSTLSDVRIAIQDIDNPFNLLKSMGVDNLMDQAVEKVADGVKKAKRDHDTKTTLEKNPILDSDIINKNITNPIEENNLTRIEKIENKLNKLIGILEKDENRDSFTIKNNDMYQYNINIALISEYLLLKYGEKQAKNILLSSLYKGWASAKTIRDLMINIEEKELDIYDSYSKYENLWIKEETTDKAFLISLLNKIENKDFNGDGSLLMITLINRIKEVQNTKAGASNGK